MKHIKNYKDFSNLILENIETDTISKMLKVLDNNKITYSSFLQEEIDRVQTKNALEDLLFRESNLDSSEAYIYIIDEIWGILNKSEINENVEYDEELIQLDQICLVLDEYLLDYDYNKLRDLCPFEDINNLEEFLKNETNYSTMIIYEGEEMLVKLQNIINDEEVELDELDENKDFCPFCKSEVSGMDINCKKCDAHLMH